MKSLPIWIPIREYFSQNNEVEYISGPTPIDVGCQARRWRYVMARFAREPFRYLSSLPICHPGGAKDLCQTQFAQGQRNPQKENSCLIHSPRGQEKWGRG